jgi:hypothetical protein
MGCECDLGSHFEAVPALKEFGIRGLFVRKKEKGRLLAPSLQFRNESAAERYPVLRGEASHNEFRWANQRSATRRLVKRCSTRARVAHH